MTADITKFSESFKIRASEVDIKGKATLPALCSLFQEVAGNHALKLNFDISQLHKQNLTWVLHRMDINITRFPDWRENITIETWPAAGDALRAYRNYRILDAQNEQIGSCLSYWMMINMETRRPTRMPPEVLELRLKKIDHVLPVKNSRMKPFEDPQKNTTIDVRRSDEDMNRHVNNARYVEWMMEIYDENNISMINEMDIIFLKESKAGDRIISSVKKSDGVIKFQLKNQDKEVLALAECKSRSN
jgi:acyl-ACP thioesterase